MAEGQKEEKKCFICGATKNLGIPFPISGKQSPKIPNGIAQQADESAAVMLKMELKHTKIKRVITLPGHRSLHDPHYIIQANAVSKELGENRFKQLIKKVGEDKAMEMLKGATL